MFGCSESSQSLQTFSLPPTQWWCSLTWSEHLVANSPKRFQTFTSSSPQPHYDLVDKLMPPLFIIVSLLVSHKICSFCNSAPRVLGYRGNVLLQNLYTKALTLNGMVSGDGSLRTTWVEVRSCTCLPSPWQEKKRYEIHSFSPTSSLLPSSLPPPSPFCVSHSPLFPITKQALSKKLTTWEPGLWFLAWGTMRNKYKLSKPPSWCLYNSTNKGL